MIEWLSRPWPWYIAGPLIGMMVPFLLIVGNKTFGISSALRHICAAMIPSKIPFFSYNWRKEAWNLFFVSGVLVGGFIAAWFLNANAPLELNTALTAELSSYNVSTSGGLLPTDLFSWDNLFTIRGFILVVVGGFFVGFGTRYAGGCTSGHSIMGLSNLQLPSLIATCCFMAGGFFMANVILPMILKLV